MKARTKIDLARVRENAEHHKNNIPALQVAVNVMCGGGMLGRMAAEQPGQFYIDARCGKLPYPRRDIEQAVAVLSELARANSLDPNHMPKMPDFHGCGVF